METRGKRPSRATATGAVATEMPVLPEAAPDDSITPATQAALGPAPATGESPPDEIDRFGREALAAFAESQAAMARGLEAISDAMAGLTRSGIDIAAHSATEMLGIKTMSDAFRVGTLFARKSFDGLLDGSAKLSGLGVKLAAEASRPILTHLGQGWINAVRLAL
jgi:hypothetical protein